LANSAARTATPSPITVTSAPPNPVPEVRTSAPTPDSTWVPGSYTWQNNQWRWTAGRWATPPSPSATWVPGSYNASTRQWTEGHWTTSATNRANLQNPSDTQSPQR
ncbi:MAG TPA: hypothetical protein VEA63_15740, partial [Opitutus sp.]|nr:hypothetical protein [Opitutus sp.]